MDFKITKEMLEKGPFGSQIRQLALKKVTTLFPDAKPSERGDLTWAVMRVALDGGQRDATSLEPLVRNLKRYELRTFADAKTRERHLGELVVAYREIMSFIASLMNIMNPGWVEEQVRGGAESVPLVNTEVVGPGLVEVVQQADNNPRH